MQYCRLSSMGCTARGGDSILNKKRLLALAVIGAALALSAVMVVSLRGDDKPEITNDQPSAEEQPASTPMGDVYVYQAGSDDSIDKHHGAPVKDAAPTTDVSDDDGDDDDDDTGPGNGNGNGNGTGNGNGNGNGTGNGNGNSGSDGTNDTKAHGLERAIEVHIRNIEKQDAKHNDSDAGSHSHGNGLENSLEHLQMNLEKQTQDAGADHGNGHGQANGNSDHA